MSDISTAGSASGTFGACPHCGMVHQTTCPRIKAIEYHQNGTVKRVEFHEQHPLQVSTTPQVFAGLPDKYQPTGTG